MNELTKLFGNHLEQLGELCETDARITQNPVFYKSTNSTEGYNIIHAGDVNIACFYDYDYLDGKNQIFSLKGQPSLIVTPTSIIFIQRMQDSSSVFRMMEYFVDAQRHLHAKQTRLGTNSVSIVHHIYDEHGVEMQRDCLEDDVPKQVQKILNAYENDVIQLQRALYKYFLQFKFNCSLGKLPSYKQSKKSVYQGYRRDMKNIEIVSAVNESGVSVKQRLDLMYGLATMTVTKEEVKFASKEDLAASISLEENEEVRNALIGYCAFRGVTKDQVLKITY